VAVVRGLAVAVLAWWAVFRWLPEDQPPARVLIGPFTTQEECEQWEPRRGPFPTPIGMLEFVQCVELEEVP
jgi:hypothetical protein